MNAAQDTVLGRHALSRRKTVVRVLSLPRGFKRLVALSVDAAACIGTVWMSYYLRVGFLSSDTLSWSLHPILVSLVIALPVFVSMGLYRAIFRYADTQAVVTVARAVGLYAVPFALIYTVVGVDNVPRTVGLIQPLLLFVFVAGTRLAARSLLHDGYMARLAQGAAPNVLIFGAGRAGRELASALRAGGGMRVVGFVDDDPALWGSVLAGVRILRPGSLADEVSRLDVSDILLAVPSATRSRRAEILEQLQALKVHVRTLPSMVDIARGKISVGDLREPSIEDILGREPVPPDAGLLARNIAGKRVMVTGAGGSIGSELCRQILAIGPADLLLLDHAEYNLYAIHQELERAAKAMSNSGDERAPRIVPLLASVTDAGRIDELVAAWRPATIIHAAAYKHVPLVEHNAAEGTRNNVIGTLTVAQAARAHGVANFLLVSTDKAVRPTNVMGATKRLAEMVLQALQAETGSATCFSMVRFGNVLGSSGSVVPLFRDQIAAGGPVTVTHAEVTRYFMTIPEAAQLVLQAGAMARGGDVFVLDMGEPVRIVDLAANMIHLSGLSVRSAAKPDGDIAIEVVGLRPGEKLYEELLIGADAEPSSHPRILRAHEHFLAWSVLGPRIDEMRTLIAANDAAGARQLLRALVREFEPSTPLADLTRPEGEAAEQAEAAE